VVREGPAPGRGQGPQIAAGHGTDHRSTPAMSAGSDYEGIRNALEVLSEPSQVIEIRILRGKHTRSGYFDDLGRAAEAAAKLNGTAAVYATLNPCNPALLARGVNRIVEYPEATTSDRDILRRVWFPIDLDPVRPAVVSSTEVEHEVAIARAREVFGYLQGEGWPDPLAADSGNGAHLLYRIALPNDAKSTELLKRCLQALALRFGDDRVSVDETVFNAARIWKLYGTIACKGDNTPERPHRQAKLLRVPDELEVVPFDKLAALAGAAPKPSRDARSGERFDLDRWISDHGLDAVGPVEWGGGRKWIFRVCPWNEDHRNRSAYVVQFSSGAIAAGCHHNGCHGKDWAALRAMFEPGYQEDERRKGNGAAPGMDSGGTRLLPSPSNPLAVARKLIEEKYQTGAGLTLINHRGDFFQWDGACWPERDRLDIRQGRIRIRRGSGLPRCRWTAPTVRTDGAKNQRSDRRAEGVRRDNLKA
jgi:hypothetical protein